MNPIVLPPLLTGFGAKGRIPGGVGILLLAVVTVAGAQSLSPPWGKRVLNIQLETGTQLRAADFPGEIMQRTGQPLSPSKVEQTLKSLYATGRFRTLGADVKDMPGGVDLILAGEAQFFTGTVRVSEQGKALSPAALAASARLSLGRPLSAESLQAARQRIQSLLASEGYYRAQIHYSVRRNLADQVGDVTFLVDAGPPAKLSGVNFQGHNVIPAVRLAAIAGWRHGIRLTTAKIAHGLYKIRKALGKRGYWAATSRMERRVYNSAHNSEELVVAIQAGPLVHVYVEGARISSSRLKKILPVYTDGLTDDLSLDAGAKNLSNYFEEKGYFSARAKWRRITHPNEINITYAVDLGPQSDFVGYDFQGNRTLPATELSSVVTLRPASFPSHTHGVFSEAMLDNDVQALEALYHSKGFFDARVTPHLKRQSGTLFVIFDVQEGPRTLVGKLAIHGVDEATRKQLIATMQALPGHPYSPSLVARDRNSILTYLSNQGYNQATVTAHVSPPDQNRVNIDYEAEPGLQETVRRVLVVGNQYTRTSIIRRALTLQAGEPLSQSRVFESQRKLYNMGLFNEVEIAAEDPGGSQTAKTILVRVDEANRWTLGYGFGLDVQRLSGNRPAGQFGVSPRLSLDVARINVGGRNQTFSLRGRLSDLETGGEASYLIPNLLNHSSLSLHPDFLIERTRDVLTFTSTIRQASLTLEKQYSPSTFLLGRYTYRLVSVSNLRINPLQIPLFSQPVRDAGFESTLLHDTRDNPVDATRGSFSLLDGSVSYTKLGSQANLAKFFGQNSTYYHLASHLILARNTEFGVEEPYGPRRPVTVNGKTSFTNEIPLALRFFAGGSDSIRAFSLNQAGPRDAATGYPIGGNALFVNQVELRMPFREGRYGLVLFDDAGNVYSDIRLMRLLKFHQTSLDDLNYTVDALGIGIRYRTPIGPVRLDLSYVLNPPRFEFTQPALEVQRLPKFQYFISIGQSF